VVVGFGGAVVVVFADGVVIVTLVAAFGVEGAGVVLVVVAFCVGEATVSVRGRERGERGGVHLSLMI
jgi:hypothetical protein